MDISEYHLTRRKHFYRLASTNAETESLKLCSHLLLEWYEAWRSLMADPHPIQPWLSEIKPWLYDWQTDRRYFAYWDVLKCLDLGLGGEEWM